MREFDPRNVEVLPVSRNWVLDRNTEQERQYNDQYIEQLLAKGIELEKPQRFWTQEDLDELTDVCRYLSNTLPARAFGLDKFPGFQIFVSDDCIAVGSNGNAVGSYTAIRQGLTGLLGLSTLGDRNSESKSGPGLNRFTDAARLIFLSWMKSADRAHGKSLFPQPPSEVEIRPYNWEVDRLLFTEPQRAYREAVAKNLLENGSFNPERYKTVDDVINSGTKLYASETDSAAWLIANRSILADDLSHGLNLSSVEFLDRAAVALASM